MNIAFVSSGNSIHVKKIANYLVGNGHKITLYTMRDSLKLKDDFDKRINIVALPFSGKLGYYLNAPYLKRQLQVNNYDLVNSHYASGYGTLSRLTGVHPISLAVFGADVYDYPFKSKANMRRVIKNLNNADVITSTSNVMADKVREFYHTDKEIFVTPFGVDLNIFKPLDKKRDDCFVFGIIKKIEPKYGVDLLIKAYKKFKDSHPNANSRLVIYGRGSSVEELKQLSLEQKISNEVQFEGFISNEKVPEAFNRMNVACFPSVSESFGVAAVEAMACGVPVIVSDAPGFTEVVENGVTGLIVKKKSDDELSEAMTKMYEMSELDRMNMGKAGVKRVQQLYNFEDNMDLYEKAIFTAVKK